MTWWLMGLVAVALAAGGGKLIAMGERQADMRARLLTVEQSTKRVERMLPHVLALQQQSYEIMRLLAQHHGMDDSRKQRQSGEKGRGKQ
jgi:hypothetical protein